MLCIACCWPIVGAADALLHLSTEYTHLFYEYYPEYPQHNCITKDEIVYSGREEKLRKK